VAEAASFAKRDLRAGQLLDGIGGFDLYGLIVRADEAQRERLLPIGLASYARLRRDIARDEPIPLDAVEFEASNTVLELRQRQDRLVAATAVAR
jgi:predicted homoserine dehydrogenase-like protein